MATQSEKLDIKGRIGLLLEVAKEVAEEEFKPFNQLYVERTRFIQSKIEQLKAELAELKIRRDALREEYIAKEKEAKERVKQIKITRTQLQQERDGIIDLLNAEIEKRSDPQTSILERRKIDKKIKAYEERIANKKQQIADLPAEEISFTVSGDYSEYDRKIDVIESMINSMEGWKGLFTHDFRPAGTKTKKYQVMDERFPGFSEELARLEMKIIELDDQLDPYASLVTNLGEVSKRFALRPEVVGGDQMQELSVWDASFRMQGSSLSDKRNLMVGVGEQSGHVDWSLKTNRPMLEDPHETAEVLTLIDPESLQSMPLEIYHYINHPRWYGYDTHFGVAVCEKMWSAYADKTKYPTFEAWKEAMEGIKSDKDKELAVYRQAIVQCTEELAGERTKPGKELNVLYCIPNLLIDKDNKMSYVEMLTVWRNMINERMKKIKGMQVEQASPETLGDNVQPE